MKTVISLSIAFIVLGSLVITKKAQAQIHGGIVPIVLYKLETGHWQQSDDNDGDGVKNNVDPCPEVYGTVNGCPDKDTDGDGVFDSKDKCPDVKGLKENDGCLAADVDTDGDGIVDAKDDCPNVKGSVNGCPDSDGDGVVDSKDECPEVKGTLNGCPDSDGDGVVDSKDDCPKVKGTLNGCPDTDGDGVADSKDDCPNVKGTIANNGCLLSKEEMGIIKDASAHIYFQSGSAKIKKESYSDLDRLAEILKKHPEVKAKVEGHTDSSGNADANLKLSKARAAAVKKYLVEHGEKEDHITSEGYGSAKPIAPNNTKEGKAKNRRVEVVVSAY